MTYPTLWRAGSPSLWGNLFNTRREFDRLFDRFVDSAADAPTPLAPAVDVRETADAIEVSAELPGLRPEDVGVSIEKDVLTISGEKKHEVTEGEAEGNYHLVERRYGRFERSFTLPRTVNTEKIDARFENGVLVITLPKAEEAKARRINIAVGK